MSYFGTLAENKATVAMIEESENTHSNVGSKILAGSDTPGGAASGTKPGAETQVVGRLRAGIKTPKTRTDSLTRKYASTGSN
jgi:hypothetical protein